MIETIFVAGAGQMGSGIAQVAAAAGYQVLLHDVSRELVERGLERIRRQLGRDVERGRRTAEDRDAVLARIRPAEGTAQAASAELVIEAIVEDAVAKKALFRELDAVVGPDAILASNTSSIPITELASVTSRPDRFIGMHFMNPVPVMQLVEVVRGLATSDATHEAVLAVGRRMGKTCVTVRDFPGFVSNRLLMPMINEAVQALMEGVASAEDIDAVMRLGMNHPMGPLALADFIGLDTCLAIMEVLYEGFGDPKYRPSPLLRQMVRAGRLGRKTGQGFYRYDEGAGR
ncbi:MAG: 3-hydroxybutyryl-CoA dehydrogenase [Clostridia bacterium]|nr:3-hydroxybutyryl-CoA dehydrogenase [Clostridia bacterium]